MLTSYLQLRVLRILSFILESYRYRSVNIRDWEHVPSPKSKNAAFVAMGHGPWRWRIIILLLSAATFHFTFILTSNQFTMAETESDSGDVSIQELQETVSRLSSHKGVQAVLILNRQGDILAESLASSFSTPSMYDADDTQPPEQKHELAKQSHKLLASAKAYLESLDPSDDVAFLQLRSKNNYEVMIAPHEGYVLAVSKRL